MPGVHEPPLIVRVRLRWVVAGCALLAAASLLAPSAPSYDPWSWLIWGRELAGGDLDTRGGPAWKPLPVAVTAVLSPAGDLAPELWLVLARAAALLAAVLAWRLAARLGAGTAGGALAAAGVLVTAGWLRVGAAGGSEGLLVALALLGAERHLDRSPRQALACAVLAALVRVEAWPFVAAYGLWLVRRDRALVRGLVAAAVLVPAAWLLPELAGSGDLLRSSQRARVVDDAGAPALAGVPVLASLGGAVRLVLAPVLAGCALAAVAVRRRELPARAVVPLAAGAAWWGIVAAMSEAGYSGEARYALPGAASIAITGACGLAWGGRAALEALRGRPAALAACALGTMLVVTPFAVARLDRLAGDARALADTAELSADLETAIAAAGGREALLRCGRVFVGARRGPLAAWHLRVHKAQVGFRPASTGVILRSALRRDARPAPGAPPAFTAAARAGRWTVLARCRDGRALGA